MSTNTPYLSNVHETKVLITDYVYKDIKLYENIVKALKKSGASVYGLYNATTVDHHSNQIILDKFYWIIPIVLDTTGGVKPEAGEDEIGRNYILKEREIQFRDGFESKLVHSLPNFNHIINFGSSDFVKEYMRKRGRPFYRINEMPISSLESKLRTGNLIEQSDNFSIVHVLFEPEYENQTTDRMLQINDKKRTVVVDSVSGRKKDVTPYPFPNPIPKQEDPRLLSIGTITRMAVVIRLWILLVQKFVDERVFGEAPLSYDTRMEQMNEDEINELKRKLRDSISKSLDKLKYNKKKLSEHYSDKKIEVNRILQQYKNYNPQNSTLQNNINNNIHNTYVKLSQVRESTKNRADHNREIRKLEKDIKDLNKSLIFEEKALIDDWYYDLLRKQAKILSNIESKYYEKSKALKQAFLEIQNNEFEVI